MKIEQAGMRENTIDQMYCTSALNRLPKFSLLEQRKEKPGFLALSFGYHEAVLLFAKFRVCGYTSNFIYW